VLGDPLAARALADQLSARALAAAGAARHRGQAGGGAMLRSHVRRRCRRRRRLDRKKLCRWCGVRAPVARVRPGVWRRVPHHDLCTRCYLSAEDRLRAWALSQEQIEP